jgi:hypothetical protein
MDADPEQRAAMNWCAGRPEHLSKGHGRAQPARNLGKDAEALRKKCEVVVIDNGARVTGHAHVAVGTAHWLVIAAKPSEVGLDATAQFLDIALGVIARRNDLSGDRLPNQQQEGIAFPEASGRQVAKWDLPVFQNLHSLLCRLHRGSSGEGSQWMEFRPSSRAAADMATFLRNLRGR